MFCSGMYYITVDNLQQHNTFFFSPLSLLLNICLTCLILNSYFWQLSLWANDFICPIFFLFSFRIHTFIHTHIYTHSHTHAQTHTSADTNTHLQTHIYIYTRTRIHEHTHDHTKKNTHTRTHKSDSILKFTICYYNPIAIAKMALHKETNINNLGYNPLYVDSTKVSRYA